MFWITGVESVREKRRRRYEQGDCVFCGIEERIGTQVLGPECREKNNARRRMGARQGRKRGVAYSVSEIRSRRSNG
jgi:hypothetical protein